MTTQEPTPNLPGYNVAAVEAWIIDNVAGLEPPFTWTRCEGGHSNLTYEIRDGQGQRVVVRRPPEGELLPKAHDMGREFTIIDALWSTPVPVAQPYGLCTDTSVTGAPFYVMGFVDGRPLYTVDDVEAWIPPEARPNLARSVVETLAALHTVDPVAVGLGELGRHDGYVARQLRTWYGSWNASKEVAKIDDPAIHQLHDRLQADLPDQGPPSVVHGDFGVHNNLFDPQGNVLAVVDWEISTLGDPLADLAYLMNMWVGPDDDPPARLESPTLAPGFPDRQYLADHYAELTGRDLSGLGYYQAFNYFKSACIIHGVYARYVNGQKAIDADELADVRQRVGMAQERARLALATL